MKNFFILGVNLSCLALSHYEIEHGVLPLIHGLYSEKVHGDHSGLSGHQLAVT